MSEELAKVEHFIQGVEEIAKLLRGISMEAVATAIREESCERQISLLNERRKAWSSLFLEMGKDMNDVASVLLHAKIDSDQCLSKVKQSIMVFNGSEFKEATNNLARFVKLCEQFQSLKNNGFLDKVIEAVGRT